MVKRRKSRKMDYGFDYRTATKDLTGTLAFGTTALVGTNLINSLRIKI